MTDFFKKFLDPNAVVTADDVFIFLVTFMKLGQNYDAVFPLLDILRLSMLNFSVAQYLTGKFRVKNESNSHSKYCYLNWTIISYFISYIIELIWLSIF